MPFLLLSILADALARHARWNRVVITNILMMLLLGASSSLMGVWHRQPKYEARELYINHMDLDLIIPKRTRPLRATHESTRIGYSKHLETKIFVY